MFGLVQRTTCAAVNMTPSSELLVRCGVIASSLSTSARRALLVDELSHGFCGTCAVVLHLGVISGRPHDKRGEALDLSWRVVGGGVDLGNHHVRVVLELLAELVILGREGLAVTAPRGVELDQHVLFRIEHDVVKR